MITNELLLVNNIFLYKFASWCFQGDVCKLSAEFSWISCSETWLCPAEEGPLLPWKSAYLSSEKTTRQRFSVWLQPNFIMVRSNTSLVILRSIVIVIVITIAITIIIIIIMIMIIIYNFFVNNLLSLDTCSKAIRVEKESKTNFCYKNLR